MAKNHDNQYALATHTPADWERLAQVSLEHASEAIFWLDEQARIVYANRAASQHLGYAHRELLEMTVHAIDPVFTAEIWPAHWEQIRQHKSLQIETQHRTKDGRLIPVEINLSYVELDDQEYICAFVRDITERKQVEVASSELSQKYEELVDTLPIGVYRNTPGSEGHFLEANAAIVNMFEADSKEEFLKYNVSDLYRDPADRQKISDKISKQRYVRNEEIKLETLKGKPIWASVSAVMKQDSYGQVYFDGIIEDITDRKRIQEAVAKQAAELATVAQVSTAVSTTLDTEKLLQEVVDLTKSSFDLYHAHIYLLDKAGEYLVLTAGADQIGRQMVAQGHQIPLNKEQSLVARAARTRQGIIVNDALADPYFLPNPLLPDTRSEMAVPMVVGERLLGVLDVQANVKDRFSAQDVNIQTTLAAQVAVALQNARQYEQAQSALEEANRFRQFIEASADGIGFATLDGHIQYTNEAFRDLLDEPTLEAMQGKHILTYYPEDLQEQLQAEILPVIMQAGHWRGELTLESIQGRLTPTLQTFFLMRDTAGNPLAIANISSDISDLKQAEKALRENEARLQAILDNLPVGVFVADASTGNPLVVNNEAIELLGRGVDPERGTDQYAETYQTYVPGEDTLYPTEELPLARTLTDGEINKGEVDIVRPDGRITVDVVAAPILDFAGNMTSAVALFQDVTERKRVEERLRLQQTALEAAANGIAITKRDGTIIWVNSAFTTLTGYEPEEAIGDNPRVLRSGKQKPEFYKKMWETILAGEVWRGELVNRRKDGSLYTEEMTITPVRAAGDQITHFIAIKQDVTERQQAQKAIVKQAAELETVAQVSTAVSTTLDTQKLLQEVVDLTKERFGLYHAHIHLLNEAGDTLILTAGAGDVGREMVVEGRQIPLAAAESLVATAARTKQAQIRNYESEMEGFMPHPLLIDTRSEMAVPIIIGAEVLGVLDIRSDELNYFSQTDVRTQTTLASQIAVALQNARSFERSEIARQELSALTQRLTREGWEDYLNETAPQSVGYTYDSTRLTGLKEWQDAAKSDGQFSHPLLVQGEAIGQLALAEPKELVDDASDIVQAIADSLSAHIENLRLTEQTQAALTQTESLYAASDRIVRSSSMDGVLHALVQSTAIQKLDRSSLILFNEPWEAQMPQYGTVLAIWRQEGVEEGFPMGTRYELEELPTAKLFRKDQPFIVQDAHTDARLDSEFMQAMEQANTRGLLIVPLIATNQWIGVLLAGSARPLNLTESDIRQISALADQAATVVANQRLLSEAQARAEQERRVRTITDKIRRGADREAILRIAREEIGQLLGTPQSTVQLGTRSQLLSKLQESRGNPINGNGNEKDSE